MRARDVHHRQRSEPRRLLVRALVLEQCSADNALGGAGVPERRAAVAPADLLVAIPDDEDRFVPQIDGKRDRVPE
jgi:hypothetical protein